MLMLQIMGQCINSHIKGAERKVHGFFLREKERARQKGKKKTTPKY